MKKLVDLPFDKSSLTQTLPSDLAERAKLAAVDAGVQDTDAASDDNTGLEQFGDFSYENNVSKRKTKVYEPKPLTPQDDVYEEVMAKVGSRPVKPKYWFEEFGDYWSCSCGHINRGETCVGCGLERKLLRSIFILHKPMDVDSHLGSRISQHKERIDQEAAYKEAVDSRVQSNTSTDLNNIKPIAEDLEDSQETPVYTDLDEQLPVPAATNKPAIQKPQMPKPRMPRGKILIAIIVAATFVLIIGISIFVKYVAAPAQEYDEAVAAMEAGNYEQALEMFQALEGYNDSDDMVRQCYIGMGQTHFEAKEYNDAIEDFETAQRYDETPEVADMIRNCYIAIGDRYQKKSKLNKAIEAYRKAQEINKTEDIREQIRICFVGIGDKRLAANDFKEAFKAYNKAQSIKETDAVKSKINDTKFAYLKANLDSRSDTVESYLNDLKDANYPGIQDMYDEYYAWHVKIVANNNPEDYSTKKKTFSKADTVYFHIKLTGGEPNEKIQLYYTVVWPDGNKEVQPLNQEWKSGSNITARFAYPMPFFGMDGKLTFTLYDSQSNNELGKCSATFKD